MHWQDYVVAGLALVFLAVWSAIIYNAWQNEGGKYRWPAFWRCFFTGHDWQSIRDEDIDAPFWGHVECAKCGKWQTANRRSQS